MAMDYDTQVGVEIDAEFQQAINATKRMIEETQRLCESLKGMTAGMNAVHNLTKAMKTLSDTNFSNIDNQINSMVSALSRLSQELSKLNLSGLTGIADDLRVLMNSASGFNLSWIQQLQQLPKAMESIKATDAKEVGKVFSTLSTQIQPFLNNIEKSRSQIKSLANTGKEFSKFNSDIEKAKNKVKELGTTGDKTKSKIAQMFTVGRLIYFYNMSKQMFRGIGNIIGKAIDFGEVENLFSVAMRDMCGEALKFQNQLSEVFGLALPDMMKAQGIFKNMLSSLRGLNEETSTMLSQTLTKMSVDFASLYNTSIESAITKLEAALSRQVRPIRSVSGYDITQNVLQATAENIGITDRAIAQMGEMEKRLLIIITLQDQMRASGAMGDFARTIEMPAQQLKILQQQLAETGRWIGAVFMGTVGKVLPYINGFVMAIKEVIKVFALFVGYKMPDSSGVTNILDQMAGSAGDYNDSIESANRALDKTKKKVKEITDTSLPFDELNVIPKDTSSDSGGSSSGGSPSLPSGYIDPRILGALSDYDNLMSSVEMKATRIRDKIMDWLGFTKIVDEETGEISWKLRDGFTNIEKIGVALGALVASFAGWKIATIIGDVIAWFKTLSAGVSGATVTMTGFQQFLVSLYNAISGLALSVSLTSVAITAFAIAFVATFVDLYTNCELFRDRFNQALENVATTCGDIVNGLIEILNTIYTVGIQPLVESAIIAFGILYNNGFAELVARASIVIVDLINCVLKFVSDALEPLVNFALNALLPIFTNVWNMILAVAVPIIEKIMEWINMFLEVLDIFINFLSNHVFPLFKTVFDGLSEVVQAFWVFVQPIFDLFTLLLSQVVKFALDFFLAPLDIAFKMVVQIIKDIIDPISKVLDGVKTMFQGVIDFVVGVFTGDWSRAWDGVKGIFKGMWDTLAGIVETVWNTITGLFSAGGQIFVGVVDGIADVFKNIVNTIISGINKVIAFPFDKVNGFLNFIKEIDAPIVGRIFFDLWGYNPIPVPQIPTFRDGGFLNGLTPGQLFIMNEPNNPEFLTNVGGKTGVANQGQMTVALKETMKQGLLEAFAMMPQNQYDPVIEVHNTNVIDGEQLSESVNKAERRKGFKFVKGGGNL